MAIFVVIMQVVLMFVVPLIILKFKDNKFVKLAGPIGVAYLAGIIIALIRYALSFAGVQIPINATIGEVGSHVAIAIAIPLLLFCTDLKATRKLSKPIIKGFAIEVCTVVVVVVCAFFAFREVMAYTAENAGMAIGIYTGGTPNLNSIGAILGLDAQTISIANVSEMIIGGLFYVFLLFASKPLLNKILGSSKQKVEALDATNVDQLDEVKSAPKKPLFIAFLIALASAVISAGIGLAIWAILGCKDGTMMTYLVPALLIGVTVFGIIGSFNTKLRNVKGQNSLGTYFILVFSFALAMTLDLSQISSNMLWVVLFYLVITVAIFVIHVIFCKIFKVDADSCIVTLSAGIYGPAFIPAITKQLKNDKITSAGLICGSLGYAIGTFLGVGISWLLLLL